jgi:hypothetical protein
MNLLDEIQRDMAFMGWKGDPATGFTHKEDVNGNTIARRGDNAWVADVEESTERVERQAIIRELERRDAHNITGQQP